MMKWTLIFTLLLLTCLEDVSAKGGKGRFFGLFGTSPGSSSSDGIFVGNPVLDFLIFLAIVGGILMVIGIAMAAWKAVRGPIDPSERGLLDSESENDSEYNLPINKTGKQNYGISNPEEIFTDTKKFVERAGENRQYQKMPENRDNRMDIDSSSHRMFDLFDRRPRMASQGPWHNPNYQNIQEQPPNYYYNSDEYYRD